MAGYGGPLETGQRPGGWMTSEWSGAEWGGEGQGQGRGVGSWVGGSGRIH